MSQAKKGDNVKINLTGKLDDGSVFAKIEENEPLEFKLGEGRMLAGIENAVEGMNEGESKSVNVPSDQAYGQRRDELVFEVSRDKFPQEIDPEVGQQYEVTQQEGRPMMVRVVDTSEQSITLDGNHPLAGRDLTFDLQLMEVTSTIE